MTHLHLEMLQRSIASRCIKCDSLICGRALIIDEDGVYIRQLDERLTDEAIKMPRVVYSPTDRVVEWGAARYNTIYRVLTNPIYAGTYVYGRTGSQVRKTN